MDRDYILFRILFYLITPEHSDPSFIDKGKTDYYMEKSYPAKIKGFLWVCLAIGITFITAFFLK